MNFRDTVSVVVPTYNRAHILHLTIPTYLQNEVKEIIIVDDCSTDNTQEIVNNLQKKYTRIRYIRNEINSKQTYSKNVGIKLATGKYIFFGDDDSVINKGCISTLLYTMHDYGGDVVGARAIYADSSFDVRYINSYLKYLSLWKRTYASALSEIVNLEKMTTRFDKIYSSPAFVPFCHACALVRKELAEQTLFDINYTGCAYREETDFFIRITLSGKKIIYDSKAVSINLPTSLVRGGGAHTGTSDEWYISAEQNNWYFLEKNWEKIQEKYSIKVSKEDMQREFMEHLNFCKSREQKKDNFLFIKKTLKQLFLRIVNLFV